MRAQWRDKEKEHVPKNKQFAFHEQKIKCKLHVPAKVRAALASQKGAADAALGAKVCPPHLLLPPYRFGAFNSFTSL